MQRDIYTVNGNLFRMEVISEDFLEIELEFLFENLFWSRLFCFTIWYIVFFL